MESILLGLIIFIAGSDGGVALRLADSVEQALYQLLFQCIFPENKRTELHQITHAMAEGANFRPDYAQQRITMHH
ncbi:MAG: hypothetical protein CMI02_01240 [Oceanospirillaceae bacterium]|nr:hypothetical protein [Oceanospirillaceae bacterium]MBT10643.1 hypothetical protein [Oceanospirillaceae bacterium]|tara:strand:+ start:28402 stop:28626 length:225 start_codon:yes stop_codon:yes gene_type:complete